MNNVNMTNMNPMGGPVGAPMPMMNNGAIVGAPGPARQLQPNDSSRANLNTYIYDYFLRFGMYDCARAILNSDQPVKVQKDSSAARRDENGNILGNGLGDDPMETDSKEDVDGKRPDDLPVPLVTTSPLQDSCFLYEWFCMFWDIFNAQKGKGASGQVNQYVSHTQHQNRMRLNQQQDMLRQMRPDMAQQPHIMMRGLPNGNINMMNKGNNLQRAAMANNQNPQMQMLAQKQGQMQRDPSDMDGNRQRPASPTDNAPSPSKRARLDAGPFNPNQPGMMPNGRPAGQGMPGQQAIANSSPGVQAKTIQTYAQNLQQHHGNQMPNKQMPNPGGPQGQGSPMIQQGPDNAAMTAAYYNAADLAGGPGGMRPGGGAAGGPGGSHHALQDYQMQLMLLEQQNKKRLMMARQEQDGMQGVPRPDGGAGGGGPGGPGAPPGAPNAQPFQGTSPQGARTGASPNPTEQQMKRAGQMNNANMGSPLPEGAQNRESPNPMNFMGNQMDPNGAPHFFKPAMNGMEGNMVPNAQMNGMRPPSSHPGQPFNGQMNPQQQQQMQRMQQQLQQQQQQQQPQGAQGGPPMQWAPGGPNGNQMAGGPQAGPQQGQQVHGTPQQRAMPPPSAPAVAANSNANQRNQTASPQVSNAAPPTPSQGNKPAPKKKDSKAKDKRAANQKKSNANLNAAAGATPAADPPAEPEPPAPATPITPMANQSFNKPGQNAPAASAPAAQPLPNGQAPAAAPPAAAPVAPQQHPDPNQNFMDNSSIDFGSLEFANPLTTGDVLTDFDFDTFLHDNVDDGAGFDFNASSFGMEGAGEIGAD